MGWPSDWGTQVVISDDSTVVAAGEDGRATVLWRGVSGKARCVTLWQRDRRRGTWVLTGKMAMTCVER
jgi:hypothetical protein